jgi:uncharacterized protein YraI
MFQFKKMIAAGALAAGVILGAPLAAQAQQGQTMTAYPATDLNLRAGPGTQFQVLAVMSTGTPVTVDYCLASDDWCHLWWNGVEGWASANYLSAAPPQYTQPNYAQQYPQYPQQQYPQQQYPQQQYPQQQYQTVPPQMYGQAYGQVQVYPAPQGQWGGQYATQYAPVQGPIYFTPIRPRMFAPWPYASAGVWLFGGL